MGEYPIVLFKWQEGRCSSCGKGGVLVTEVTPANEQHKRFLLCVRCYEIVKDR